MKTLLNQKSKTTVKSETGWVFYDIPKNEIFIESSDGAYYHYFYLLPPGLVEYIGVL